MSESKQTTDVVTKYLINLNQKLLDSIVNLDYETYDSLCSDDISCMEPESNQNIVIGKSFHKYYFDVYGSDDTSVGGDGFPAKKKKTKNKVTMLHPHVQLIHGKSGDVAGAVLSYVKLVQSWTEGQAPVTTQQSETRVWENRKGKMVNVHFHKSPVR